MTRLLGRLLSRLTLRRARDHSRGNEELIERLRARGVRIGRACSIHTEQFSTEPYLVTIGDRVGISGGTKFLTHDGSAWLMRRERPAAQSLGTIVVGSDTFIGENCVILPNTSIGAGCIIGAGSVLRGTIPDNSLAAGNPAVVVGRASLLLEMLKQSPNTLDSLHLVEHERRRLLLAHFGLSE